MELSGLYLMAQQPNSLEFVPSRELATELLDRMDCGFFVAFNEVKGKSCDDYELTGRFKLLPIMLEQIEGRTVAGQLALLKIFEKSLRATALKKGEDV